MGESSAFPYGLSGLSVISDLKFKWPVSGLMYLHTETEGWFGSTALCYSSRMEQSKGPRQEEGNEQPREGEGETVLQCIECASCHLTTTAAMQ